MDILSKFFTPGIIFLLTLVSGIWLSNSGKPLNTIIFNIHKLIALAAVVVTSVQIYKIFNNTDVQPLIIILAIITGLCVIALFATGALMSLGKLNYDVVLTIHRIALILLVISMALIVYLLTWRKL
jgi:hypothetical protein